MSTVNATTQASGTTAANTPSNPKGVLGKEGFLKLLVGQMKNMDPMDPKGSMDIGQMAQMSMVEQLTTLAGTTQSLLDESRTTSVLGLVGRTVTYSDDKGTPVTGVVSNVTMAGSTPSLTVNGVAGVSPDAISEVS